MLDTLLKHLPELFSLLSALSAHRVLWRWAGGTAFERAARLFLRASAWFTAAGVILEIPFIWVFLPHSEFLYWMRGAAICWAICLVGFCAALWLWRKIEPAIQPERRAFLAFAKTAILAAPVTLTGYGVFVERRNVTVHEVDIGIPGLHPDLNGLRIAQVTDLHVSPFLSPADVADAVARMNELKPHFTVITGDLITRGGDPLDECIAELARLRADSGVFGCLGNHEIHADCEDYVTWQAAKSGIRFLRSQKQALRFGSARINLVGVDYQRMRGPYLVGSENLLERDGSLNLLLSHNPDAFRVAKRQGWDLTLSGHTHGGQVTVEYLEQHLNLARFYTKYVSGLYREEGKSLYVSRGLGTVGAPIRLAAPPELTLIKLCAT